MRFGDLATRAALGVASRPVGVHELPDAVLATLPGGDGRSESGADPAVLLLDAAASYALARAAEVQTGPDSPLRLPEPTRPEAPPAFAALLRRVRAGGVALEGVHREALALVGDRGFTLPGDLLLEVLRDLDRPGGSASAIAALLDARGWALASLDARWSARLAAAGAASEPGDAAYWTDGSLGQRVAYLRAVRAADPDAGRALVAALDLRRETAEAREALLGALASGLSAGDEPLLEAALDDRAKAVRTVAARLLGGIAGSGLVRRAERLAVGHLTRTKRLLRGATTVGVGVPASETTKRDGYPDARPDTAALGRDRLAHVVSLVPPDRWPALLGATASELASEPVECDGAPLRLRPAWVASAVRWGDLALARTLLADRTEPAPLTLFPLLPDAEQAAFATAVLRGQPQNYPAFADALPASLGPALAESLAGVAQAWLQRPGQSPLVLTALLRRLALGTPAASATRLASRCQAAAEHVGPGERALRQALLDAASTMQLRGALADSLAPFPQTRTVADPEDRS